MSATIIESSVRTFDYDDAIRWRHYFGLANHAELPHDLYGVMYGIDGHMQLRDRTIYMPVGLYVAIDYFDRVLYIGQVCRSSGTGIVERISGHHAIPSSCSGIWLLPLRDDLPKAIVSRFEGMMIRAFQPPANQQLCGRGTINSMIQTRRELS